MAYRFTDNELQLSPSNQYFDGQIVMFNGQPELVRKFVEWEGDVGDFFHRVQVNDSLDKIAFQYYDGKVDEPNLYWWLIADANDIQNPFDLSDLKGVEIVVPNIERYLVVRNNQIT